MSILYSGVSVYTQCRSILVTIAYLVVYSLSNEYSDESNYQTFNDSKHNVPLSS